MIEVEDLHKTYRIGFWQKQVPALRGAAFRVNAGDLFGFIGPNGAGKSTAIKILLGLLRADSGKVLLMGKSAGNHRSRDQVGFLPEQPYFYDYLTGAEFLNFYGRLSRLSGAGLRRRIGETAEEVGIKPDWLGRKLRTYSKGMLQRLGLAQALLGNPQLVILDEPMSGLDPLGRRDVRNLLKRLHAAGATVFYSSHVLGDVEAICTRLAMIVDGQVRREGTVTEVLSGEEEAYQVTLGREVAASDLPAGIYEAIDGRSVLCRKPEDKASFLQWALGRGLEVVSVGRIGHTLEDVLAEEVARII